jgi:glyoxylase-like metal-dependent hydrolase (beta-lactamase superfamily II)
MRASLMRLIRQNSPIREFSILHSHGWALGDRDVLVMEDRGHSPDHVLFYVPEHSFLYSGDVTFEFFGVWPDADSKVTRDTISACVAMVEADQVKLFADGHHHCVY